MPRVRYDIPLKLDNVQESIPRKNIFIPPPSLSLAFPSRRLLRLLRESREREMDSRERDQQPSRQVGHSLSSLIVRPSDSGGGGGGGGSDYEPGEVRRENPSRSARFTEKNQGSHFKP